MIPPFGNIVAATSTDAHLSASPFSVVQRQSPRPRASLTGFWPGGARVRPIDDADGANPSPGAASIRKGRQMNTRLYLLSFGIGAMLLASDHAFAQTPAGNCGPRDHVVARLAESYGESRQSIGLGGENQVVEVFASLETGTWTITVTLPNGMTCLVASGQAFEAVAERLPAAGSDA
jgi:hypothetical protein